MKTIFVSVIGFPRRFSFFAAETQLQQMLSREEERRRAFAFRMELHDTKLVNVLFLHWTRLRGAILE